MFVAIMQSACLLVCRRPNRSETACSQTTLATRRAHAHILCHYAGVESAKLSCHRQSIGPLTPGALPLGSALLSFCCCDSQILYVLLNTIHVDNSGICFVMSIYLFFFITIFDLRVSLTLSHGAFAEETNLNLASIGMQLLIDF